MYNVKPVIHVPTHPMSITLCGISCLLQDEVVKAFELSKEGMQEVELRITADFQKGLEREGEDVKIKMLVTYVHSLPDGSEQGNFLGLDLGGSNFRVLLISEWEASSGCSSSVSGKLSVPVSHLCTLRSSA